MVKAPDDLRAAVWDALAEVRDPEIPPCRITDLGIVQDVRVDGQAVEIDLLPTFAGCPALDVIREDVEAAVGPAAGGREVRVAFVYSPPWTSDRITPAGREALRAHGITPPRGAGPAFVPLSSIAPPAVCPFCGGRNTVQDSAFGPTLCRATHYCPDCRNPFEAFKPKLARA